MRERRQPITAAPDGVATANVDYRVPFFDTDAMGIVHHANYVRYLELSRVEFLRQHDEPYQRYVEQGFHVAVIRVETHYHRSLRFDDVVRITCWLDWVKGVSLGFRYVLTCDGQLVLSASTDHAVVDMQGRPHRMPPERRDAFRRLLVPGNV
jgi:acyl-CoA thioester hydrolase